MEFKIRTGIAAHLWNAKLKEDLTLAFQAQQLDANLQPFPADQLYSLLESGDLDVVAHPLHLVPLTPPEGIAYAALLTREEPLSTLLVHPDAQASGLFHLKEHAKVHAPHPAFATQLLDFRPDLVLVSRKEDADAFVLDPFETKFASDAGANMISVPLNPREVCPPPGSGAIVLQTCADDLPLRKALKSIHQPETAMLTNVERKVLRLLGGNLQEALGVFCERDLLGYYQVWVCHAPAEGNPLKRERLSSSTSFELAELAVAQIK